ncbi:hypothetical protein [Corallococcus silvisoli]|uniref:hypothetical protein n=1 Tax=Corallococcus silvisoli TaxID=2697031 RepID=UPI001378B141|nr:hypothetical protein [Corallococcus silvisoli]NBD12963.1 hypothetical protein [Corallococcus silvisoli]
MATKPEQKKVESKGTDKAKKQPLALEFIEDTDLANVAGGAIPISSNTGGDVVWGY